MNFWKRLKTLRQAGSTTLTTSQGEPFTVLAPMANVTDWAFRDVVADCGRPDVFYTEFIIKKPARAGRFIKQKKAQVSARKISVE